MGIKDNEKLAEIERMITLAKDADYDNHPIKSKFDLKHLCKIHHYLFCDIYDWAGKIRGEADIAAFNREYEPLINVLYEIVFDNV